MLKGNRFNAVFLKNSQSGQSIRVKVLPENLEISVPNSWIQRSELKSSYTTYFLYHWSIKHFIAKMKDEERKRDEASGLPLGYKKLNDEELAKVKVDTIKQGVEKRCLNCRTFFESLERGERYCSSQCRIQHYKSI